MDDFDAAGGAKGTKFVEPMLLVVMLRDLRGHLRDEAGERLSMGCERNIWIVNTKRRTEAVTISRYVAHTRDSAINHQLELQQNQRRINAREHSAHLLLFRSIVELT